MEGGGAGGRGGGRVKRESWGVYVWRAGESDGAGDWEGRRNRADFVRLWSERLCFIL